MKQNREVQPREYNYWKTLKLQTNKYRQNRLNKLPHGQSGIATHFELWFGNVMMRTERKDDVLIDM